LKTSDTVRTHQPNMGTEVADVLLYLMQLASALGIDPIAAAQAKLKLNALKYPMAPAAPSRPAPCTSC
jgi:NTP pyrophosphatase (non-canonical NTP hydrolase)